MLPDVTDEEKGVGRGRVGEGSRNGGIRRTEQLGERERERERHKKYYRV